MPLTPPFTTAPTILYSHDTTRTPPDTARASDGDAPGRVGREWRVGRFRLILSIFVAGERLNRIVTISIGIYFVRRLVVRVGFKLVVPIRGSVHHKRSQDASFSIKAVHTAYEAYSLRRACGLHSTHVRVKQAQAGTISLGLSSSSPAVEEGICVESRHAIPAREVHGEYGG